MAKKILMVLLITAVAATGAFAQFGLDLDLDMSAGLGGYISTDSGGGSKGAEANYFAGGGFLFFDLTFAEVSAGYFTGTLTSDRLPSGYYLIYTGIDIGLLFKYPIEFGGKLILFPALGINYRLFQNIMPKSSEGGDNFDVGSGEHLNSLFINAGLGTDYYFTDKIFIRGTALAGLRLPNKSETDTAGSQSAAVPGFAFNLKIAIGFRL